MFCWEVVEHGKPLVRAERATPTPKGKEILVRVRRCGVCHSDVHVWDGYFDLGGGKKAHIKDRGIVPPITLGHEPLGCVEALGPDAEGVEVGQNYIVYPWLGCGECSLCLDGQDQFCPTQRYLGIKSPGAFATHLIVPDARYLVRADGIDPSFAATLACSGLTAYGAIRKLPSLEADDWVVVLGCGGLGLLAISILKALGLGKIVACDIDAGKLLQAKAMGADAVVNTRDGDSREQLVKLVADGAAGAIDFVGMPLTANLGISAIRKGGRYIICGLFGGEITLALPPIAQRAISIIGSFVGSRQELEDIVALAKSGKLTAPPLVIRPADEITPSLEDLRAGRVPGRVVLNLDHCVT